MMRLSLRSIVFAMLLPASGAIAQPPPTEDKTPVPTTPPASPASVAPASAAPFPVPAPPLVPSPPPPPAPSPIVAAPTRTRSAAPPVAVTYDKGLTFESADAKFGLHLSFRNQVRFESLRPMESGSQFASRFSIPRARLVTEGHAFGDGTRFRLELSFGDLGSYSFVRDLVIDQRLGRSVWLRAGQWKRPFSRQWLVSDFASELNERAITAAFVGDGRDLGVGLHNDYERSPAGLEWVVGVFNGFFGAAEVPAIHTTCTQAAAGDIACATPPPTTLPTDFQPAVVARVGWNFGGIRGYSEGDLEGGPLRVAIGASYKIDLANLAAGHEDSLADNLSHGAAADLMIKAHGFGLELGAYLMKIKTAAPALGYLAQAGQFLVPRRVQLAARFAYAPLGDRHQIEARGAFNVYWQGHAWKWATDVGALQLTGQDPQTLLRDKPDYQLRTMLQLTL